MKINWVLADNTDLDYTVDINRLKQAGPFWGSWRTWRAYNTDNVVCYDSKKAKELVKKGFGETCNFYVPKSITKSLKTSKGIRVFDGTFDGHNVSSEDEIISLNLASSIADIVLLLGFDFTTTVLAENIDITERNQRGLVIQCIKSHPDTQFICVDHNKPFCEEMVVLPNLGRDKLTKIYTLLNI